MKRTATLVAGLLLVTGTVFAEGKLDFSGTVIKAQTTVLNTNSSGDVNDDSNGDTDIVLKVNYDLGNNTTATFKFDTDSEDDTYDDNMNIMVKTVQGKVEAQFDAALELDGANSSSGIEFRENQDSSDTYIKYNHTGDLAVTFYPFNMGLSNGSNFDEGDSFTQIPGLAVSYKGLYVGAGMDTVGTGTNAESVIGVKAGYETAMGAASLKVKYSGAFWDDDKLTSGTPTIGTADRLGVVVHDVNVQATYKVGTALTLTSELGMEKLEKDAYTLGGEKVDNGFGAFVKGSYAMTDVVTPYASFQYSTDGYVADGDMFDWNEAGTETGGVSILKVGADYKLTEKLVLNGEARLRTAGEKIFTDKDGAAEDSDFRIAAAATFTF